MIGLVEFSWGYWALVAFGCLGLLGIAIWLGETDYKAKTGENHHGD